MARHIRRITTFHKTNKQTSPNHPMQLIFSTATFTHLKTESCTQLYTQNQQTRNHTSTASHTIIQEHKKDALHIVKHYVSEEYVQKKKNIPKRQKVIKTTRKQRLR